MHCKTCNLSKLAEEFYASNKTRCKECVKASVTANRQQNLERIRAYDRARGSAPHRVSAREAYQRTRAYSARHSAAARRWASQHPERRAANVALGNAVRAGRVTPWPVCAVPECSDTPQGHHPDYSRPLDVVWLCDEHHRAAHAVSKERGAV